MLLSFGQQFSSTDSTKGGGEIRAKGRPNDTFLVDAPISATAWLLQTRWQRCARARVDPERERSRHGSNQLAQDPEACYY